MYTFKLIWTWYPLTHDLTLKCSIEMSSSVNQTMCQNLYLMQAAQSSQRTIFWMEHFWYQVMRNRGYYIRVIIH